MWSDAIDDAARHDARDLGAHERERIRDVVDDEARDGGVERPGAKVEHGALVEARVLAEPRAALPRAAHHLRREVDAVHEMPRAEERLRDEPGAAARVEEPRAGLERRERDESAERRRVGLDGRPLEPLRLAVEGA